MPKIQWGVGLALFLFAILVSAGGDATTAQAAPVRMAGVDTIIQQAISDNNVPGAVLVVGHNGSVVYRKAYGSRALEPRREVMTAETIFDLASLTKVIATTTAVMQLMEHGKIRMNDPVGEILAGVCAKRQRRHHRSSVDDTLFRAGARS